MSIQRESAGTPAGGRFKTTTRPEGDIELADINTAATETLTDKLTARGQDQAKPPPGKPVTTHTPWGRADYSYDYGRGITNYSCPGHGGFKVSKGKHAEMHPAMASIGGEDGWYEEDCDWAAVAVSFPENFPADHVKQACRMLKDYHPDEWEQFSGEKLSLDESSELRRRKFLADTRDIYVGRSASRNRETGMTEVIAERASDGDVVIVQMTPEDYESRCAASRRNGGYGATFQPGVDQHEYARPEQRSRAADCETTLEYGRWKRDNPDSFTWTNASVTHRGKVWMEMKTHNGEERFFEMTPAEADAHRASQRGDNRFATVEPSEKHVDFAFTRDELPFRIA